jgi:hypothetical protein
VLAGRRIETAGRRLVGDTRSIAERPRVIDAFDLERRVDDDAAALVEREAESLVHRIRAHARSPNDGVGQDPASVGKGRGVRVDRLERRLNADVDPASGQFACGVLAEPRRDLREDFRCSIDEYPVLRFVSKRRVVAQGIAHEIRQLTECLDAGIAGTHEHERELAPAVRLVRCRRRSFEPSQYVVAQVDRIGK